MCQANTRTRIISIMVEQTGFERDRFAPEARLEDLNIDSLDIVEIIMAIEETFGAVISDEQISRLITVADIFKTVEELHG